ncbi:MAG: D-alanyl-D-alanine carboxypeptidase [Alphaproteobacteria bacterium]|nr:D-alanyl-D-alanine carboxypeptidase [Alphaproteobacteria bacterium]
MNTHSVLLDKGGDEAMAPSSMSKLMTAYLLFQRLKEGRVKLDDQFTISEKAWRTQGSKTFVPIGGQISVEDLIHGIIIQSGNDACIVVAENLSGNEEAFVENMNRVAKEIGLKHSHFVNATGLPEDGHVMSPRDLATLAERIIRDFPEYYHYFSIPEYTYNGIKQQNRNRLLTRGLGVDGLKTGHAEEAGYGITASAKEGERRLILVINGLPDDKARVEEGDRLLRWGLREFQNKKLVTKGRTVAEADVWFGKAATIPLVAQDDLVVTMPATTPQGIAFTLKYTGPIPAPIEKGAKVAELVINVPGQGEQSVPLFAGESVEKLSGFGRIGAVLGHYLLGK